MPRKMMGPGSAVMGGGGKKPPPPPPTPFGGPASGAMPGGSMTGAMPRAGRGGPRAAPGASMPPGGGSGMGFKKGGGAKKYAKGGEVHGDEAEDRKLFRKMEKEEDTKARPGKREREEHKYAHGGPVIAGHATHGLRGTPHKAEEGISKGLDSRRSVGMHGADSRVHKPHSGKAG